MTRVDLVEGEQAPSVSRVMFIGAGGHARMCLEVMRETHGVLVVGAVSLDGTGVDSLGTVMLGRQDELETIVRDEQATSICVAIGDNTIRDRTMRQLREQGHEITEAVSRHALVSPSALIGVGAQIMHAAVVNAAATIDDGVIVNTNALVEHDCHIARCAHISTGVALGGNVTVGARTLVGVGARVLPGVTIGSDATVGVGAVVVDDVPDGATVVGVPARPISHPSLSH